MMREEAIGVLKVLASFQGVIEYLEQHSVSVQDACNMAIQALSQEPCDDTISRDMALKECHDIVVDGERYRIIQEETLLGLPPVTQKPETVTEFADRCRECGAKYGKYRKEAKRWKNKWLKAQKSGKWIPVSERLPEDAYGCLVTVYDTDLRTQDEFENILPYFVGYDGETWNNADGEPISFEVIAWMPLPKPYEPQERSEKE